MRNYTLEKLKNIIKKRLQDEEFDDDILTTFINFSQDEILGEDKYPFMERVDIYEAEHSGAISLPPDYSETVNIFISKDRKLLMPLTYLPPNVHLANLHKNCIWTKYANNIYYKISEKPSKDTGCETYQINHFYIAKPRPLEKDTDRPMIPDEYIEALILGALYRAEQLRGNFDFASIYQNQQDTLLTNMKYRNKPGGLTQNNTARLNWRG